MAIVSNYAVLLCASLCSVYSSRRVAKMRPNRAMLSVIASCTWSKSLSLSLGVREEVVVSVVVVVGKKRVLTSKQQGTQGRSDPT